MESKELPPGGFAASFGRGFDSVLPQKVCDGAAGNDVPQIAESTLDSGVSPSPIPCCHANCEFPNLIHNSRTPRSPPLAPVILLRDQLAMPGQQGLRAN